MRDKPPRRACKKCGMLQAFVFLKRVVQRVQDDSTFAQALSDEAATLFLGGEPEIARMVLRDLVNATIGFE